MAMLFDPEVLSMIDWKLMKLPKAEDKHDAVDVLVNYHAIAAAWLTFMLTAAVTGVIVATIAGNIALALGVIATYVFVPMVVTLFSILLVRKHADWEDIMRVSSNWWIYG